MTDLRTAAQQALKALENAVEYLPIHSYCPFDDHFEAIKTLKAALAQPEPAAPQPAGPEDMAVYAAIAANYKAAPTVVEPVARDMLRRARNLLTHPPIWSSENAAARRRLSEEIDSFIATPPRAALTDEQIDEIAATNLGDYEDGKWHLVFARAVIAASGGPRNE